MAIYKVYYNAVDGYHNHTAGQACVNCPFSPTQPRDIDGVYQISNSNELFWFSQLVNGTLAGVTANPAAQAVLIGDITINANLITNVNSGNTGNLIVWESIGTDASPFTGSFDGQGHTISGLYFNDSNEDYVGLFGKIGADGVVKNVGVLDSIFTANANIGGIAGYNAGTVSGSYSKANIAGNADIGGITGANVGTVTDSYFLDSVVTGASDSDLEKNGEQFTNGEVTYLLNGDQSAIVWGGIIPRTLNPTAATEANRVFFSNSTYHNHTGDFCNHCNTFVAHEPTNDGGVYEIGTVNELFWFGNYVNGECVDKTKHPDAKAVLTANITVNNDLSAANLVAWTPIGSASNAFAGSFDGKGFTISGLYADDGSGDNIGLFGVIGNDGTVSNLAVTNSTISGGDNVGVIAGQNNGKIIGCYTYGVTLNGTVTDGIFAAGTGTAEHSFSNQATAKGTQKTDAQFANGSVAYLLNGDQSSIVWGQLIDTDPLPVAVNAANRVYYAQGEYHNHTAVPCDTCPVEPHKDTNGNYLITTERELLWFAEYVNSGNPANAVLENDIAVSDGFVMTPVGTADKPFNGTFDGKCCSITNLNINLTSDNVGLFGVIGTNGKVSNLAVKDCTFEGAGNVGGIAGTNNGEISGCYTYGVTLTGTTADGIFAAGTGTAERSFSDKTTAVVGAQKTAEQFTNGDVAYNLNFDPANPVWGQLVNSAAEPLPVAVTAANRVYYAQGIYHNHDNTDCPYCPNEPEPVEGGYQIFTENQLLWFEEYINSGNSANAVLMNDITLSGRFTHSPIGTSANPFNGSFNGNGHTISGLNFSDTNANNVGLFGYVSGGTITKLRIADSSFSGNKHVGAVCGYNEGADISECYVEANVKATMYGGGICGYNGGTVSDCLHIGTVEGKNSAGIVGKNKDAAKVKDCVNLGKVSGSSCDNICGSGRMESTNDIENCYYNADLTTCLNSYGNKYSTMEITADDFLPGSSSVWAKTANDYANHILYYPNLKNIILDPVEVNYTPSFVIANENSDPVYYGDDLVFSYEAVLTMNGNDVEVTNKLDPLALLAMDFVIEHNGEVLYDEFTLSQGAIDGKGVLWLISGEKNIGYIDISGLTHTLTITEHLDVGENTFRVTYTGEAIPWFTGTSGSCSVIIVQAAPTVEEPTASEIDYGVTLGDSELSDTDWSWVNPDIIPKVSNNGYEAVIAVDDKNYDYSNISGYNSATHTVTRTISLTVNPATPVIVVKPVPSAALPGKTVTVSATVTNPNNSAMTDLPAVTFFYKVGSGAETAIDGSSFVIPENFTIGTIIEVIARTSETANYTAATVSANVIVTDCKHESKTFQYNENSHWYHCDNCGADLDIEEHKGGTATCTEKAVCTVCEQAYGSVDSNNHVHIAEVWSSNALGHWHECEACHAQVDKAAHNSSGPATEDNPEICTICSYLIQRATGRVANPEISPNGGSFSGSQKVTITCTTDGATIYYTTNGDAPTADSTKYTGEFTITSTTTVKAIALKLGVDDSEIAEAEFTKKSSGGGGGSSGGGVSRPTTPTEPKNLSISGISMSWIDIAAYIAKLPIGSEVMIELNGNTTVPVEVVKVIDDRYLKVTFVYDSVKSWKTDGAEITAPAQADLSILTVSKLKTDELRGISGIQFTINNTNIPTNLTVAFKAEHAGKFANLYKFADGKLTFVTCAKLGEDGKVILPDVTEKGDYVVMLCEFSDLLGDMNNDGAMTAADASAILNQIVGIANGANPEMADLNGDGKVTAADASAILKRIVGLA